MNTRSSATAKVTSSQACNYTPYGFIPRSSHRDTPLAFCGQLLLAPSVYLLGNGYRCYDPVLMRFYSPDNLSPFERGGYNAYAYCQGDPVNRVDPDGHGWFRALFRSNKSNFKYYQHKFKKLANKRFKLELDSFVNQLKASNAGFSTDDWTSGMDKVSQSHRRLAKLSPRLDRAQKLGEHYANITNKTFEGLGEKQQSMHTDYQARENMIAEAEKHPDPHAWLQTKTTVGFSPTTEQLIIRRAELLERQARMRIIRDSVSGSSVNGSADEDGWVKLNFRR